jgi:transmembrane sensor
LRIPENFEKSYRTVELISGEADFHVVHNAKSPFRVKVKGQITQDIGTEFNINAYPDEAIIKTTLLEGAVRVSSNNRSSILKPGQQAAVNPSSNTIRVYNVDTDEAFAWKNGKFIFSSIPLDNIMRQLSRWYDVEVFYQDDNMKQKPFSAISTRFANASQVLHDLELTGEVKFKIQGKRITVLKNNY